MIFVVSKPSQLFNFQLFFIVLFLDEKNQKSRRYNSLRNNYTLAPSRAKAIIALLCSHIAAAPYRQACAQFFI